MIDLLQDLLTLRLQLMGLRDKAEVYGVLDSIPEFSQMQKLERSAFAKVQEWEKPDA